MSVRRMGEKMLLKKETGAISLSVESSNSSGETGGVYPKGFGMGTLSSSARSTMSPQVLSSM